MNIFLCKEEALFEIYKAETIIENEKSCVFRGEFTLDTIFSLYFFSPAFIWAGFCPHIEKKVECLSLPTLPRRWPLGDAYIFWRHLALSSYTNFFIFRQQNKNGRNFYCNCRREFVYFFFPYLLGVWKSMRHKDRVRKRRTRCLCAKETVREGIAKPVPMTRR